MKNIISIKVVIGFDDKSEQSMETIGEDFFVSDLMLALRNGRDVANAMFFLADEGSKYGKDTLGRQSAIGNYIR